jgi:hypothetical protein
MLKNNVNKYLADLRPDQLTTYQSQRKLVVSRRPDVLENSVTETGFIFILRRRE